MRQYTQFYINGRWVDGAAQSLCEVINPATEQAVALINLGAETEVDSAVAAAKAAFEAYSQTTIEERMALLSKIIEMYQKRYNDVAEAIRLEMGAPSQLAATAQAGSGLAHLAEALKVLQSYEFEEVKGAHRVVKEPIGVCALITPWNWPMNQIACKVAPALATGCTMVLKPSEVAPLSAYVFAEIMDEAGVPAGVFNLINGDGAGVGTLLSKHKDVDLVSFTGSTRAGSLIAQNAAPTVKRVTQELGGKSPNIILPDADIQEAVVRGAMHMFHNAGQSCNAPSRMLVHRTQLAEAEAAAAQAASPWLLVILRMKQPPWVRWSAKSSSTAFKVLLPRAWKRALASYVVVSVALTGWSRAISSSPRCFRTLIMI
jgi:aldehyde dehydrogenase (NAD+)